MRKRYTAISIIVVFAS